MRPAEVERVKLTANLLNSVAAGTVIAVFVAPIVGVALGTLPSIVGPLNVAGLSIGGMVFAVMVHLGARRLLLSIRDDE
jgi:hypothetical protein